MGFNGKHALISAFAIVTLLIASGCLGAMDKKTEKFPAEITSADFCAKNCQCMFCTSVNKGVPYINASGSTVTYEENLFGGTCDFSDCNSQGIKEYLEEKAKALDKQTKYNDVALHSFMVGMGSSFADFDEANTYCGNGMQIAVQWLIGKNGEAPPLPTLKRTKCYLENNVIPLYVVYTDAKGKSTDPAKVGEIAKTLSGQGPVMITAEANYDSSNDQIVENVRKQVVEIRANCKDCKIILMPKNLDMQGLDMVMGNDEVKADVNIIGQGILANNYSVPNCDMEMIVQQNLDFSRQVLQKYGKPTIWVYFGVAEGQNFYETCEFSKDATGKAYEYVFSRIPELVGSGVIGFAGYQLYDGQSHTELHYINKDGSEGRKFDPAWGLYTGVGKPRESAYYGFFDKCQKYYGDSGVYQVAASFSKGGTSEPLGGVSCSMPTAVSTLTFTGLSSSPGTPQGTVLQSTMKFSCNDCEDTGVAGTVAGQVSGTLCTDWKTEIDGAVKSCPSTFDPYFLRALMWQNSGLSEEQKTQMQDEGETEFDVYAFTCRDENTAIAEGFKIGCATDFGGVAPPKDFKCLIAGEKPIKCGLTGATNKYEGASDGKGGCGGVPGYDPFDPQKNIQCGANNVCNLLGIVESTVISSTNNYYLALGVKLDFSGPFDRQKLYYLTALAENYGIVQTKQWLDDYAKQAVCKEEKGDMILSPAETIARCNNPSEINQCYKVKACCDLASSTNQQVIANANKGCGNDDFEKYMEEYQNPLLKEKITYAREVIDKYTLLRQKCATNCGSNLQMFGAPQTPDWCPYQCGFTGCQLSSPLPPGAVVTSAFCDAKGTHCRPLAHQGVDLDVGNSVNIPVYSAQDGVVTAGKEAGCGGDGGCHVYIQNTVTGCQTRYYHLAPGSVAVSAGDTVSNGNTGKPQTKIGVMGESGHASGIHLHFEIWYKGVPVNPGIYNANLGFTHYPDPVYCSAVNTAKETCTVPV
ncbi:Peptidase family M23 [Candidatus Gugararchaeum adminiculabundum]|nr:Peptidase family M23 [Candidatus Gugararchaeum adminiculabundum]